MEAIFTKEFRPGQKWSGAIGKNRYVRFTALGDNANVSVMLYNYFDKTEIYNMPDTLKEQHKAFISKNDVLMSDNGRIFAAVVEDSLGWHDVISGHTTRLLTDEKYGKTAFQQQGNDWLKSAEENFKIELVRNGLRPRDMKPCINFFSKVTIGEDGSMNYDPLHCSDGATVMLKTEMSVFLVLSNTPNPLDPSLEYPSVPMKMEIFEAPETTSNDPWYAKTPESERAYFNTITYHKLLGL